MSPPEKEINYIHITETREKVDLDIEGDYRKWRQRHPPLPCELSVNQNGTIFWLWTIIVATAVSYNLFSIPALVYLEDEETASFLLWANICADVVYLIDILVQSRLTFFRDGIEEYSLWETVYHYAKNQFLSDFCSSIPMDLLFSFSPQYSFLRLNRLGKMGRLFDLFQLAMKRWPAVVVALSKLVSLCALLFHWNGCAYFYLGTLRETVYTKIGQNATFDDDVEWDWAYQKEKITDLWTADCEMSCQEKILIDEEREDALMVLYSTWLNRTVRWRFSNTVKEYVQSMYWSCMTITTLGEQPSPDDSLQTLFEILDTLVGMVVFAGIMGGVGNLVSNANKATTERKIENDGLKQFMNFRGVGEEMVRRVLSHCADELARGQRLQDGEVKEEVSDRVFLAMNKQSAIIPLVTNPMFSGCGHSFLADIGMKLVSRRMGPGDVLAREGDLHTEMYIVARGHLILSNEDELSEHYDVAEGAVVGETGIVWLDDAPKFWPTTVYSREYSQVFCLSRDSLFEVLDDFPHLLPILSAKAGGGGEPKQQPRTTAEKLESLAEMVEELNEQLDDQYERFIAVSSHFKQRLHRLESGCP